MALMQFAERRVTRTLLLSVLAMLSAACWGFGTVLSRMALASFPPLTLLLVQLGTSVVFLTVVLTLQGKLSRLRLSDIRAGLPGLLEPGLAYGVSIVGLSLTSASSAALISAVEPIFVLGLAWLVLGERVSGRVAALALLALIGVGLVGLSPEPDAQAGSAIGNGLLVLGTIAAALYVVLTRRLVQNYAPLKLTLLQQLVGLGAVGLLWLLITGPLTALPSPTLAAITLAVLSGIVQFALAFWLYLIALRGLPAAIAGFYLTLTPLFGVAGAALLLGERLTLTQSIGAGCILVALMLVSARPKSSRAS